MGRRARFAHRHSGNTPSHKYRFGDKLRHEGLLGCFTPSLRSLKTNSITTARDSERTMGSDLRDDAAQGTAATPDAESACQRLLRGTLPQSSE